MTVSHDVLIVDAHQHFWDLTNHRYPWLDAGTPSIVGDTTKIRSDYLPETYIRDAFPFRILGSVHLDGGFDPGNPAGETVLAESFALQTGYPNGIIGAVDLGAPDLEELIQSHISASTRFRGVRQIVAWHEVERLSYVRDPHLMRNAAWRAGYGSLKSWGLSADMQIYPGQMSDAAALAGEYPDVPMIINQAGMPEGLATGDHAAWRRGIRELAQARNVSIKISGFGMLKPDWSIQDVRPLIEEIVDAFGPRRVMLGSNYPVDKLFKPLSELFATYIECLRFVELSDLARICSLNAIDIYRLEIPQSTYQQV